MAGLVLVLLALGGGLWIAAHRVPWVGPLVADSLRAVVGSDTVTRLEEWAYAAEDRWNQLWLRHQPPKAYWQVPASTPTAAALASTVGRRKDRPARPAFRPTDVGPMHRGWSPPGDGIWVPVDDGRSAGTEPVLYKTLLHPDRNRSWAELFVVAVDLEAVDVRFVLGYQEPVSTTREGLSSLPHRSEARPAVIPAEDHPVLLAAFNGSFKTEHGAYGAMVGGITVVPPRSRSCTVARLQEGQLRIGSWERLVPELPAMSWFRQAPACMVEDGQLHPGLLNPETRSWGATLDGDTVIRRSAVGLDRSGRVLYVAITNHTTARALAEGMRHAGSVQVAQLDVNWSYPKFVLFQPSPHGLEAVPLAPGFVLEPGEYLTRRSMRDFFYLVRKQAVAPPAVRPDR